MSKQASIAPKERVNITYRPATGDQTEEVELPLRIMMLGDFSHRRDDTPLEERKPINVTPETFTEVMAAQALTLDVAVPDRLAGEEDRELALGMRIRSLDDLTPEGIARQVPELRQLLELRRALTALKSPLAERPTFRKRVSNLLASERGRRKLRVELGMGDERD